MESRWDSAMGCAVNFFRPFRPQENSLATLSGPPLAVLAPAQAVIGRAYGPELPRRLGGKLARRLADFCGQGTAEPERSVKLLLGEAHTTDRAEQEFGAPCLRWILLIWRPRGPGSANKKAALVGGLLRNCRVRLFA